MGRAPASAWEMLSELPPPELLLELELLFVVPLVPPPPPDAPSLSEKKVELTLSEKKGSTSDSDENQGCEVGVGSRWSRMFSAGVGGVARFQLESVF